MANDDGERRYPILGNGESLLMPIQKSRSGGEGKFPFTYEEAREKLKADIKILRKEIPLISEVNGLKEAMVVCLRQHPKSLAKSYYPTQIFNTNTLIDIGSRRWFPDDQSGEFGKLFFALTNDDQLAELDYLLDNPPNNENWIKDIRRLSALNLQESTERLIGFKDNWEEGKVELVLHHFPYPQNQDKVKNSLLFLLNQQGIPSSKIKIKSYNNGPTFICAELNVKALNILKQFNPLRVVRPLNNIMITPIRTSPRIKGPQPPIKNIKSKIIVGVFDGGAHEECPLLNGFCIAHNDIINEPFSKDSDYLAHGTAVAGAVLYGPLNNFNQQDQLPTPPVSVEVFRVLGEKNQNPDLYDVIDKIEDIVPKRKDIKVYNLSFGPPGAIIDQEVSRFTYVIDKLSYSEHVLFVIAAGNDGDLPAGFNRIQAPADSVNALGVGSYTYDSEGKICRAWYSCIGEGREGCKVKPDIVAPGGCDQRPIHLIDINGEKLLSFGTSFASPIVAGRTGELIGRCEEVNPLVARALLIHTAEHPNGIGDQEFGNGIILNSADEILYCSKTSVTVIYKSFIYPKRYVKLPIPLIKNNNINGRVKINWTIALSTVVDPFNAEDYTITCIEDTFHPHKDIYNFSLRTGSKTQTKKINILKEPELVQQLLSTGWKKGTHPSSLPPKDAHNEMKLRADLKWDTIARRLKRLEFDTFDEPFISLHGMARNDDYNKERIDYSVIITVDIPKYKGNLYDDILQIYSTLEPLRIRAINEIMIPVA